MKWVKLKRYCEMSGDTDDAVHSKLAKGIWLRDVHVRKAEDGALWVNTEVVDQWVEVGTAGILAQQTKPIVAHVSRRRQRDGKRKAGPMSPAITDNPGPDWVRAKRLAELTGLTIKAIEHKRQRKVWVEGDIWGWRDGGIYYSIKAYNAWVAAGQKTKAAPYVS